MSLGRLKVNIAGLRDFNERRGLNRQIVEDQLDLAYAMFLVAMDEPTDTNVLAYRAAVTVIAVNFIDTTKDRSQSRFNDRVVDFHNKVTELCTQKFMAEDRPSGWIIVIDPPDDPSVN